MAEPDDSLNTDPEQSVFGEYAHPDEFTSGFDDIETAYRHALEALDAAERQMGTVLVDMTPPATQAVEDESLSDTMSVGSQLAEELAQTAGASGTTQPALLQDGLRRVTPREVIEAAIFVGGDVALTARRLASLIGQDVDNRVAVSLVDGLNQIYSRENRPYEIRLHEGGYRLELREEFSEVSTRMFGTGPREVKLSPESLEVLAFVAWNQPVTRETLESIDKPAVMNQVRQLLRLQLVELQRTGTRRADVTYVTTQKFLSVFGLASLADLPNADVFAFR